MARYFNLNHSGFTLPQLLAGSLERHFAKWLAQHEGFREAWDSLVDGRTIVLTTKFRLTSADETNVRYIPLRVRLGVLTGKLDYSIPSPTDYQYAIRTGLLDVFDSLIGEAFDALVLHGLVVQGKHTTKKEKSHAKSS